MSENILKRHSLTLRCWPCPCKILRVRASWAFAHEMPHLPYWSPCWGCSGPQDLKSNLIKCALKAVNPESASNPSWRGSWKREEGVWGWWHCEINIRIKNQRGTAPTTPPQELKTTLKETWSDLPSEGTKQAGERGRCWCETQHPELNLTLTTTYPGDHLALPREV